MNTQQQLQYHMQWMQVQIEDSCPIACRQCQRHLIDLKDVENYAEWSHMIKGRQEFVLLHQGKMDKQKIKLEDPCLSNQPSHFLMYLQSIRCAYCSASLGIFFRTANIQNIFALKKYAFDTRALKFEESKHQIILELFKQELDLSKQSMAKRYYKHKNEESKHAHSIDQTATAIRDAQNSIMEKGKKLSEKIVKELQKKLNISNGE